LLLSSDLNSPWLSSKRKWLFWTGAKSQCLYHLIWTCGYFLCPKQLFFADYSWLLTNSIRCIYIYICIYICFESRPKGHKSKYNNIKKKREIKISFIMYVLECTYPYGEKIAWKKSSKKKWRCWNFSDEKQLLTRWLYFWGVRRKKAAQHGHTNYSLS
jgi:hypothetical protein